ncbi:hypothetical protein QE152_g9387 [Popillia japonica]|uniref:THAP-type domain-containing protein n=1 Tax=Popillia japonica TaxID=7064 RepID=A0AAW1LYG6_POPJA
MHNLLCTLLGYRTYCANYITVHFIFKRTILAETSNRYRFPVKNEQIKKIWIDRINSDELFHYSDQQLYNTVFVCGAHFCQYAKPHENLQLKHCPQ